MRGVVVVIVTLFTLVIAMMLGVAVVEPLGEHVKSVDTVGDGYDQTINTLYDALFKWSPIIVIGGVTAGWAVAWYIRRERYSGGRRGGGFR